MSKVLLVVLIILTAWFALKIARFAMRLIALVILVGLIAVAYFMFNR